MVRFYLVLAAFLAMAGWSFAQNPEWMNFSNGNFISEITSDADTLWVGTQGGLVKIDKTTGETLFYNKLNSGLSDNWITTIKIAPDGKKWIGTGMGGLNIWDGVEWKVYDSVNSPMRSNMIEAIDFDSSGLAYLATDWDIYKCNYDSIWEFADVGNIMCMEIDDQDKIWVGARTTLKCYDGNEWTDIELNGFYDFITSIAIDDQGIKWLSTWEGLIKYNDITLVKYSPSQLSMAQCVKIDAEGNKWVGSYEALGKFNGTSWQFIYPTQNGLTDNHVSAIEIDEQNNKWIGTWRGLAMFSDSAWQTYNTSSSGIPENYINTIAIDKDGNKWMGSWDNAGLIKFDDNNWSVYQPGLGTEYIDKVVIDQNGKKWVSDKYHGILSYNDTSWVLYNSLNSGMPESYIESLFADKDNNIWAGTYEGGLVRFDQSEWTIYNPANSCLTSNWVGDVYEDASGSIWAVDDWHGVIKMNETGCENFTPSNSGVPEAYIMKITSDSNGNLWFGSQGGISSFDGVNWNIYSLGPDGYSIYIINDVAGDKEGNIWVGCDGAGLFKFDGAVWTNYNVTNSGLCCNYVKTIAIDSLGTKWIGTWAGVSLFNEEGIVLSNNYFPKMNHTLKAYPNPANETITISLPENSKASQLHLLNMKGVTLMNIPVTGPETTINISHLRPGVYIILANASDGVRVAKVVRF